MGRHLLYPGNVPAGNLTSIINASGTISFTVSGWPASIGGSGLPFVVEIGTGQADDEKLLIDSFAGGTATIDASGRGWDTTTAQAHAVGETVRLVPDSTSFQDFGDHLYVTTRDDHVQYLNVSRHDVTARHGPTVVIHANAGGLSSDDHVQYLNNTRHDAHSHPAGAFATGAGAVINRSMLSGAAQGMPVGSIVEIPGGITAGEASFLVPADGSNISRTAWPLLFARFGTVYGAGDGTTTFGTPDCRDRVRIGSCASPPDGTRSARAEASTGGEENHVLVVGELTTHAHTVTDSGHGHTVTDPQHAHAGIQAAGLSGTDGGWIGARWDSSTEGLQAGGTGTRATFNAPAQVGTGAAGTGVTAATGHASTSATNTGGGAGHNNMQPWIAVPVYIVAA